MRGENYRSLSDAQLLDRFTKVRDEQAFEELVSRRGPVVMCACRRRLKSEQDCQDAFQATFLTLVTKAKWIRQSSSVAGWLQRVAVRIAIDLQRANARRRTVCEHVDVKDEKAKDYETALMIEEEVARLPANYRSAIVLCHLEGHTNKEAAEILSVPRTTLSSWLAKGREILRKRLLKQGIRLSAGGLISSVAGLCGDATVEAGLIQETSRAASLYASGYAATSTTAAQLAKGTIAKMLLSKITSPAAIVCLSISLYLFISSVASRPTQAQATLLDIRPLPSTINAEGFNAAPTVSGDGLSLYFVSDRPGGSGRLDIWVSHRTSVQEEWREPQNLGSSVNTRDDDVTPSISHDGKQLYFARATNFLDDTETADIWSTKRNAAGEWSVAELSAISKPNVGEGELSISRDGLVLYFEQTSPLGVSVATRNNTSVEFVDSELLLPNVHWPDISDDGLKLLAREADSNGLSVRTRSSIDESFSPPTVYASSFVDYDAVWMPDGETILFTSDRPGILAEGASGKWGIWEARIVPEPSPVCPVLCSVFCLGVLCRNNRRS